MLLGLLFFAGPFVTLGIWLWLRSRRDPVQLARSFEFGQVLGRTFNLFDRSNGPVFVGALFMAGFSMATRVLIFGRAMVPAFPPGTTPAAQMAQIFTPAVLISGLIGFVLAAAFNVFTIRSRVAVMQGSPISVRQALMATPRLVLPALGLFILAYLGVMVGSICFVVPGVVLGLSWSAAIPVLVCEETGIIGALRRSRALAIGSRGRIFIAGLLMIAVTIAVTLPLTGVAMAGLGATPVSVLAAILRIVVSVPLTMIYANFMAAIYVELRTIREGEATPALSEVFA